MTDDQLSKMDLKELKALQRRVSNAIESFEERRKKAALLAVQKTAEEHGYSLNDLVPAAPKQKRKADPKYSHPQDRTLTWSGKGRQPGWLKSLLEEGATLEELLIAAPSGAQAA